jgi:hypothetical protein
VRLADWFDENQFPCTGAEEEEEEEEEQQPNCEGDVDEGWMQDNQIKSRRQCK